MILRTFNTSSFRLAGLYAVLFGVSMGMLFAIVYWISSDVLREQVRITVNNEMRDLVSISETSKPEVLIAAIEKNISKLAVHDLYYGLYTRSGDRLVGDLPARPIQSGWNYFVAANPRANPNHADVSDDPATTLLALTTRLADGRIISVAFDIYKIEEAQEAIIRAFGWAAAAGVIFALFGGILVSRKFLKRIDQVNFAVKKIIDGQIDERLDLSGTNDELDQLAGNFNEMLNRLQASMDSLKQVSNDIAHDLRTPLSRLKQGLEAAQEDAATYEDYALAVENALRHANAALDTFSALLRIAQIEAGTRRTNFHLVDLSTLLDQLITTYKVVAEDMGKSLASEIEPDIQLFQADQELLTQMFVNLIENALKHTPGGAKLDVKLFRDNSHAIAEVRDNGTGIPEGERKKIFQRFYRLDSSRTTPGTGMGLALVNAVAELHGTQVSISDNNPGAVFTARLRMGSEAIKSVPHNLGI